MSLTAAGPWCNFSFFRTARAPPLSAAVHHHHHPANIITASSTTTTLLLLRTRTTCLVAAEVFAHPSFRHLFPPPQSPATQPPQLLLLRAMPCSGFACLPPLTLESGIASDHDDVAAATASEKYWTCPPLRLLPLLYCESGTKRFCR